MDLKVSEMMKYQQLLQEKHPEWGGLYPKRAQDQILWGICEIGEACQLIKKLGPERVKADEKIRSEFIEEMGDVMMYFWDALMCLGVTPEEFSEQQAHKFIEKEAMNRRITRLQLADELIDNNAN